MSFMSNFSRWLVKKLRAEKKAKILILGLFIAPEWQHGRLCAQVGRRSTTATDLSPCPGSGSGMGARWRDDRFRLPAGRELGHLSPGSGQWRPDPADASSSLRCTSQLVARWGLYRFRVIPQRQSRHLHHGGRRQPGPAIDRQPGG